jgi:Arc/MetJ-type ribon-helix-helix transcriptional regulator
MKGGSMAVRTKRRRVHVVLPKEWVREIDARVGQRKRSEFIQEAVEEKLNYLGRLEAFERVAGSIADGEVPEWDTPESTAEWLCALREEWNPDRLSRERDFAAAGVAGICLESPS